MKFIEQLPLAAVLVGWSSQASAADVLKFETDVRPILKASCFYCHGEDGVKKGELEVRLVRLMAEGGKSGAALTTGDVDASLGSPASPGSADREGQAVIGGNKNRRSAFVGVQLSLPSNMLATFDQPEMVPNCDQRRNTTVANQAL